MLTVKDLKDKEITVNLYSLFKLLEVIGLDNYELVAMRASRRIDKMTKSPNPINDLSDAVELRINELNKIDNVN